MRQWVDVAHFMLGRGARYADPLAEFHGLSEDQLYWAPDRNCLCLLWHAGHIAERECRSMGLLVPDNEAFHAPVPYRVFAEWSEAKVVRGAGPWIDIFNWVRDVREETHTVIDRFKEEWHEVPEDSTDGLTFAQHVFNIASHTAEHVGRIKHLKSMLLKQAEEVC